MGRVIQHINHVRYEGDYDISVLDHPELAEELGQIDDIVVLDIQRGGRNR
jgi:hypothetical protein